MNKCLPFIFFLTTVSYAQCPDPSFEFGSDPYTRCLEQDIEFNNISVGADPFAWDFCPEDFSQSPSVLNQSIDGLSQGRGFKLVYDGSEWYGFLTSRNNNSLFRLDFGTDLQSSFTVSNLGTLSNALTSPEGIDILKGDDGNWYGFTGSGTTGKLLRLEFGSSLTNLPSVTNFESATPGERFRDMTVVRQEADFVLVAVSFNTNKLVRINFGNSLSNTVTASDVTSHVIPGAVGLIGLDIVQTCSTWYVHTVSFSDNAIQQLYFGSDILSAPVVQHASTYAGIANPFKIKIRSAANKFYALVSNQNAPLSLIDFDDLSLINSPVKVENPEMPSVMGLDVLWHNGKIILMGGSGSGFSQAEFENMCPVNKLYSFEKNPDDVKYFSAGSYPVELRLLNENRLAYARVASVSANLLPILNIHVNGMCVSSPVELKVESNKDVVDVRWDFGDGSTSTVENPLHLYEESGIYNGMAIVTDIDGCVTRSQAEISIYNPPQALFQQPATLLCTNNDHLFQTTTPDIYEGNLSYEWFMDDNPVSTDRDLLYNFASTGSKAIRLVTSIPGCADEMIITTSPVEAGPVVDFSFTGACEGDLFSFVHQVSDPVESYLWNFGAETSPDENPSRMFSAFGDFPVSLTATNALGCENKKTKIVTVHSKPLVNFNISGPPNACSGSTTLFQNQTSSPDGANITEWLWDFGDINDQTLKTVRDPGHAFQTPGTYIVDLSATTEAGCVSRAQKDVLIHESPSTGLTSSPACEDVPVLFTAPPDANIMQAYWEIGTSYYEESAPTHTFRSAGDHSLYLKLTATNGCIAEVNKTIHVPARLTPDFSIVKNCVGQAAILSDITTGADAVVSNEWTVSGNEIFSGSPLAYTFTQEGSQDVRLKITTEAGCTYEVSRQVPVYGAPIASFLPDEVTGAYPLEVKFANTSTGATHFRWEFSDGTGAVSTETSTHYTFGLEGTFDVVLTALNDQQCEDTFSARITTIAPLPNAEVELITLAENPDGSMKLIVTIHNKGNTILQDVPLDVDFSGNLSLRQMLEVPVLPGAKYNMVLNPGILSLESLDYLCVDLNVDNDLSPAGNRMCRKFGHQMLMFPSYPNPTSSTLNLEWISALAATIRITLTDAVGRTILQHQPLASIGFNQLTMDLSSLQSGLYYLRLQEGGETTCQRIVVSR